MLTKLFHTDLNGDELEVVNRVLRTGQFVIGPEIERFEAELCNYLGSHAVGCGSGTDALILALEELMLRERSQDEYVIVPAMTFSATAEAVIRAGGTPLVCDVDEDYLTPSLDDIKECYAEAIYQEMPVSGIILVHLYGWPAFDTLAIRDFCREYNLFLIEDCAQAFGAEIGGKKVGTIGDAGCYSFYPTKSLGGIGDAGAVCFPQPELAEAVRAKRNHGRTPMGQLLPGFNSRIDEPNAALLTHRLLRYNEENVARRRQMYLRYYQQGVAKLTTKTVGMGVPYVYPIIIDGVREPIRARLAADGVQTGTHYDPAVSQLPYCSTFCPNADWAAKHIVTLPCHHGMKPEVVDRIADAIRVPA